MFRTELDRLVALAKERGATDDPVIRQRLAWCHTKVEIMRYLGLRSLTQFLDGHQPGPGVRHLQDLLERVPPGGHRAGPRHPRRRRHGPVGSLADVVVPDRLARARRTTAPAGSARRTTPAPARSTPGRARSSATSSARWCSACPRSRGAPTRRAGETSRRPSVLTALGRVPGAWAALRRRRCCRTRRCGPPASARRAGWPRPGWWRRPPFLPLPAPDYLRFRMETAYGGAGDQQPGAGRPRHLPPLVPQLAFARTAAPVTFRRCRGHSCSTPPTSRCAWCPSRRAAVLVLGHKADILHDTGEALHSEHLTLAVPSVIRLRHFVKVPYRRRAPLNRRGVFARDDHRCQYCGHAAESIDHVVPRSRGGEHTLGERGGRLPALQRAQARPPAARDHHGPAPPTRRAPRDDVGRRRGRHRPAALGALPPPGHAVSA